MTTAASHPADERVIPEMELCDRLTRSLRLVGLSSMEVAELMGVTPTTVSRWINGRTKPQRPVLIIWSDMTGVDLDWLENGGDLRGCRDSNPKPSVLELLPGGRAQGVRSTLTPNRRISVVPNLRLVVAS